MTLPLTDDERTVLVSLLDLAAASPAVGKRVGLKQKQAQAALDGLRELSKPKVRGVGGRKVKLTQEARETILAELGKGCSYRASAAAAGVGESTLRTWLTGTAPQFLTFQADVAVARARTVGNAEARVFKDDPLAFLRLGPGRSRGDGNGPLDEGWTDPAQKHEHKHSGDKNAPLTIEYVNDWKPTLVVEDAPAPEAVKRNGTNGTHA